MSDFSVYKKLEMARVLSNSEIANAAAPVVQSHTRTNGSWPIANLAAALTEVTAGVAKYAANVVSCAVVPALSFVANTTDYDVITVAKRTGNGAAVTVASGNLANVAGTAFVPIALTLVSNAANTQVAAGDVITVAVAKTGNGVANTPSALFSFVLEDT